MSKSLWWALMVAGMVVLVFGLGCLNYTKAGPSLARHTQVARERGWPEPQAAIFYTGAAAAVVGSAAVGYCWGRRDKCVADRCNA